MTSNALQAPNQLPPAFGALLIGIMHGVPIIGIVFFGWSPVLILLIYLIENFLTIHFWNKAICRHRLLTRKRGHYGIAGNDLRNYGKEFYRNAIGMTMIHAVTILFLALLNPDAIILLTHPFWPTVIILVCVATTWFDLRQRTANIETRSFAWLDNNINSVSWDIDSMHFGVIIGGIWLISGGTATSLALPVIALRAWISYKQHRPFESLETRRPRLWEIGTYRPTESMIRQWRESMLEQAHRREEEVQ